MRRLGLPHVRVARTVADLEASLGVIGSQPFPHNELDPDRPIGQDIVPGYVKPGGIHGHIAGIGSFDDQAVLRLRGQFEIGKGQHFIRGQVADVIRVCHVDGPAGQREKGGAGDDSADGDAAPDRGGKLPAHLLVPVILDVGWNLELPVDGLNGCGSTSYENQAQAQADPLSHEYLPPKYCERKRPSSPAIFPSFSRPARSKRHRPAACPFRNRHSPRGQRKRA